MKPSVCFTETLRGYLEPRPDPLPGASISTVGMSARPGRLPIGQNHELALLDLHLQLDREPTAPGGGLSGQVHGGYVHLPLLWPTPLPVRGGTVAILNRTGPHERSMCYELNGRVGDDGPTWHISGIKPVNGRDPHNLVTRIWRETSTLYVDIDVQPPPPGWPGRVRGVVRLQPMGLVHLVASLRSKHTVGWLGALRNLGGFVGYFARRLVPVYFPGGRD